MNKSVWILRDFSGKRIFLIRAGSLWDRLLLHAPRWVGLYTHARLGTDTTTWRQFFPFNRA